MKRQGTKTALLALVAAAALLSVSACGNKEQLAQGNGGNVQNATVADNDGSGNSSSNNGSGNAANADVAGNTGNAVSGSGTSEDTGGTAANADNDSKQKSVEIAVYYTDDQMIDLHAQKSEITFNDENGKLTATFQALSNDSAKGEPSLWKGVQLLSAKQEAGAVTLDVHIPDESRLGAPGEQLALSAITQTYFQFSDVTSLNILVDGEAVESLMGHEDLQHPITKP